MNMNSRSFDPGSSTPLSQQVRIGCSHDSAVALDVIQFDLAAGLIDLSTIKLWFQGTINNTPLPGESFPRDIETIIQGLDIFINDTQVQHLNNYGHIFRMKEDYDTNLNKIYDRQILSNSRAYLNDVPTQSVNNYQFCINNWLGLLGCGALIDTRVVGKIRIAITLASNSILTASNTAATYALDHIHMTMKQIHEPTPQHTTVVYDDYQSNLQWNATYTQSTALVINSCGNQMDYAMATFLMPDYESSGVHSAALNSMSSYYYIHGTGAYSAPNLTYNFKRNGNNILAHSPNAAQGMELMSHVFPDNYKFASMVTSSPAFALANLWAVGVPLEGDNTLATFSFDTFAPDYIAYPAGANFTFLVVKSTRQL